MIAPPLSGGPPPPHPSSPQTMKSLVAFDSSVRARGGAGPDPLEHHVPWRIRALKILDPDFHWDPQERAHKTTTVTFGSSRSPNEVCTPAWPDPLCPSPPPPPARPSLWRMAGEAPPSASFASPPPPPPAMHWRGRYPPPRGRPAYAQPLSP